MGYKIYPGEVTQVQVNYEDLRMVPKVKEDGSKTCISNMTYDSCMYAALEEHMINGTEGKCVAPWVFSQRSICTLKQDINTTFWTAWNRVTNQLNDCSDPCESLFINVGGKNLRSVQDQDYGELYLYFAPKVVISQEHYLYDFVTLMAEVGGYVGLLLGFSFAHLLEWFNAAFENSMRHYEQKKRKSKVENGNENHIEQEKC